MFKLLYNSVLAIIFFLSTLALISCNGNQNKRDLLKESVAKFKESKKHITLVEYIPEVYSEVKKDTILSNGFTVCIKTYSIDEYSVTHEYKTDTLTNHMDIFKNWISEVTITKNGKLIFNETINNAFLLKNNIVNNEALIDAINLGTSLEQDKSFNQDYIYLYTGIVYPKEVNNIIFTLKIDDKGRYSFEELEIV
ncbi:MAG: hypothetical protein NWQ07_08850 [Flaviramulus sp.]|nr:hypothetical protein [Flaviramulus sp.]